jgi:two-component system, sensor histidine kinase and response regulator
MPYILIIDDDEDFSAAAALVLRDSGHEVHTEMTIANGEKSILNKPPDLIILDVMFPENGTAGFELARKIKHFDKSIKDVPVLMLTAVNSSFPLGFSSNDIDDKWLPVETFLEKPVDFDMLTNKVLEMLSIRK